MPFGKGRISRPTRDIVRPPPRRVDPPSPPLPQPRLQDPKTTILPRFSRCRREWPRPKDSSRPTVG